MKSYQEVFVDPERVLVFKPTDGFGRWSTYFTEKSIEHPAKINMKLLRHILKKYTKRGDLVLDPMAGTGSTGVMAVRMGRNAVLVELEEWMVEECIKPNLERATGHKSLTPLGKALVIRGDARQLSNIVPKLVYTIITSPPYAGILSSSKQGRKNRMGQNIINIEKGLRTSYTRELSKENIGNLRHGDVDAIISSPPYSEGIGHNAGDKASEVHKDRLDMQRRYTESMQSEENIARLKHGNVDAIVTSPPYSEALSAKAGGMSGVWDKDGTRKAKKLPSPYSNSEENIGNLPRGDVDAIVSSPPYQKMAPVRWNAAKWRKFFEKQLREKGFIEWEGKRYTEREWRRINCGRIDGRSMINPEENYGGGEKNIGNLEAETYLSAMFRVYRECFKVLKQGGLLILVTKNFVRDWKPVRLDEDTIKLCEASGFSLRERWWFRVPHPSFWIRVAEEKLKEKFPEATESPYAAYEDVLIFQKPKWKEEELPKWVSR